MTWLENEDKVPTGSAQYPWINLGSPVYRTAASILKARESLEKVDLNTGRSSLSHDPKNPFVVWSANGPQLLDTGNLQDPQPPSPTFGRSRRDLELLLNSELNRLEETQATTGTLLNSTPSKERLISCPPIFLFVITTPSRALARTTVNRLLLNEYVKSSMGRLALESRAGLGTKLVWMHSAKILVANFGVATEIKSMLLSMNFEEESTFPISSGGRIVTRSSWRLKDPLETSKPRTSGLPVISTPEIGTQSWMKRPRMR